MVHADAASLPPNLSKGEFYEHLASQLSSLLYGQRNWVSNLSNASSVIYAALNRHESWKEKKVNWAGFYLLSPLFPSPNPIPVKRPTLLLGPFAGLPACQQIASVPGKGVCADASSILPPGPVRVANTEEYPGHIACDSASKSEIVLPLIISRSSLARYEPSISSATSNSEWGGRGDGDGIIIGVLDIDCEAEDGFDEEDDAGLTKIAKIIVDACDW